MHDVKVKSVQKGGFIFAVSAGLIPVRHLNTDEHADHDNGEVYRDSEPVLFFDMGFETAEDYGPIASRFVS